MEERKVKFWKYTIFGNDFILVDNFGESRISLTQEELKDMCDRQKGIGADCIGFILPPPPESCVQFKTVFMISDGTEEYCCGDLTLAFTALAVHRQYVLSQTEFAFLTLAGTHTAQLLGDGRSKVKIGRIYTKAGDIPCTLVPHDRIIQEFPLLIEGKEWKINAFSIGKLASRVCIFVDTFDHFVKWGQIIHEHLLAIKCFPEV